MCRLGTHTQGRQPLFDDLATLDPELHKNLLMVCMTRGHVWVYGTCASSDTAMWVIPAV